jgi:hypothetical protein
MSRSTRSNLSLPLRALALLHVGLAVAVWAWLPMISAYPKTPEGDGRYFLHLVNVAKVSLLRYHELPLWNPFECGGAPLWDNPESLAASPFLFPTTWLNGTHTLWVWNLAHLAGGFVSMWFLAREEFKANALASLYAAALWTCSVCHASQYAGAHSALISFLWAPLALLLWRRAERSLECAAGLGLLLALMFYNGATYPIPHTLLMLAVETLTRLRSRSRVLAIVRAATVVGLVAVLVGAPRILPLLDQLRSKHSVIEPDQDHLARLYSLRQMYLSPEVDWWIRLPNQDYVWGEYAAYVGWIGLVLAGLGVIVSAFEAPWALFLGIVVFIFMLGHFAPWAPWSVLKEHVFPFKSMRVSARFRLLLAVFIAVLGALAIDRIPAWLKRSGRLRTADLATVLLLGAGILGVKDVAEVSRSLVAKRFGGRPEQTVTAAPALHFASTGLAEYVDQPRQNKGQLACRDAWAFYQGAPVWTGDVPQARRGE